VKQWTNLGFAACAVVGSASHADTIRVLAKVDPSPTHCLSHFTSGYVARFENNTFVVYTALASCGLQNRVPSACIAHAAPMDTAPAEVKSVLSGSTVQLFRHLVPADEVVAITFDDKLLPQCKSPPLEIEKRPGPLRQPTSFTPLTATDLKQFTSEVMPNKEQILITNWTEGLPAKAALTKGDVVQLAQGTVVPTNSIKEGMFLLAGKEPTQSDTDRYVIVEGKLVSGAAGGQSPMFEVMGFLVANSINERKFAQLGLNQAALLKPVRVTSRRTTASGFNWQGETTSATTLKMRLLSIQSGADRSIDIESDAASTAVMHLKSLRRSQQSP
jgi:hypothetical protein